MLNVVDEFGMLLSQQAVLATIIRTAANQVAEFLSWSLRRNTGTKSTASFQLKNQSKISSVDQCLIFGALFTGEQSLVGSRSKFRRARLNGIHNPEVRNPLSRPLLQAQRQGVQHVASHSGFSHTFTLPPNTDFRTSITPMSAKLRLKNL